MWLLAALFGLLMLVALIEHLHWRLWRSREDQMVRAAYARQGMRDLQVLLTVRNLIELNEALYQSTSEYGVPYPKETRFLVAQALGHAHKLLLDRVGPAPFILYEKPQSRWPFDAEGKVKL